MHALALLSWNALKCPGHASILGLTDSTSDLAPVHQMRTINAVACHIACAIVSTGTVGAGRAAAQGTGVMQATATVVEMSASTSAALAARRAAERSVAAGGEGGGSVSRAGGWVRIEIDPSPAPAGRERAAIETPHLRITVAFLD
jgi:hypothetical protein